MTVKNFENQQFEKEEINCIFLKDREIENIDNEKTVLEIDRIFEGTNVKTKFTADQRKDKISELMGMAQPQKSAPGTMSMDELYRVMKESLVDASEKLAFYLLQCVYETACCEIIDQYEGCMDPEEYHDVVIRVRVPNADRCANIVW
jgi:hypothetical protein